MDNGIMSCRCLTGGAHLLYLDGELVAGGGSGWSTTGSMGTLAFGYAPSAEKPFFTGMLDQVQMFARTLTAEQVRGLNQSWSTTTLVQQGNGVNSTTWNATIPQNLEGNYQIDVAATDTNGNRNDQRSTWGLWRGEIDTQAPRVSMHTYTYWQAGRAFTHINAWAEDLNLDTKGVVFPCNLSGSGISNGITPDYRGGPADGIATYVHNTLTDPGDSQSRLNRIEFQCTFEMPQNFNIAPIPVGFTPSGVSLRVCDVYQHCSLQVPDNRDSVFVGGATGIVKGNAPSGNLVLISSQKVTGPLVLDDRRGKLYWISDNQIKRSDTNGQNVEVFLSGLNTPQGLDIDSIAGQSILPRAPASHGQM